MENIYADDFDNERDHGEYKWSAMRLGRRLGGELLGASVYVMEPGHKSFPYHLHHANEELLMVLEGEVVVRTPKGEQQMGKGDATLFLRGPEGAHQVINRSDAPARFIMFSSMVQPEIAEYPDSGNLGVFAEREPRRDGEVVLQRILDGDAERDYFYDPKF